MVLSYLDKRIPGGGIPKNHRPEDWQSLITYRNSLNQGEHEVHPITLKQAAQRRYGKRRQDATVSDQDSTTGEQWMYTSTPAPAMHPQLASTAIKRRRMDEESVQSVPSEPGSEQDFQDSMW